MKHIQRIIIVIFLISLFIPLMFFNFKKDTISNIDNRYLTEFPKKEDINNVDDFSGVFENYVADRIGFRDQMIEQYGVLHDKVFHELVHPMYTYGKDGYVFSKNSAMMIPSKEHYLAFAHLIKSIQDYCVERNTPFVFAFTPTKMSIMTEYMPDGVNVSHEWVDKFFAELDRLGVNYVDNTVTLQNLLNDGTEVFNKKFDANHWNDIGGFYGTNAILKNLHGFIPQISENNIDEFEISEKIEENLLVSKFRINEKVPVVQSPNQKNYIYKTDVIASEIEHHKDYAYFTNIVNPNNPLPQHPRLMMVHGSHFMENCRFYMLEQMHEFIGIHNYENALNFPYYYNLFKPDCVVFEFAEHMVSTIFSDDDMNNVSFNPTIYNACGNINDIPVSESVNIVKEQGQTITKYVWNNAPQFEYAWLYDVDLGKEYDMKLNDNKYSTSRLNEISQGSKQNFVVITKNGEDIKKYSVQLG